MQISRGEANLALETARIVHKKVTTFEILDGDSRHGDRRYVHVSRPRMRDR